MDSNGRKLISIALVAVLVIALVAVAFTSGLVRLGEASDDPLAWREIFDNPPERIVSCTPGITEMLFALGLGSKVVAVTEYCDYPAKALELKDEGKTIGDYLNPNYEMILDYKPDLVLVDLSVPGHRELLNQLTANKVTVHPVFDQVDLANVYKNLHWLGLLTDSTESATELASEMNSSIKGIKEAVSGEEPVKVLYVAYTDENFKGVFVSGGGTAVDELIELAGGKNVFADQAGWFAPSNEVLLELAKDVDCMIVTSMFSDTAAENLNEFFNSDDTWKNSPAVKANKVFYLQGQGENIFNRQSVRTADAAQLLAQMLHPDSFEFDMPFIQPGEGLNRIGNDYTDFLPPKGGSSLGLMSTTSSSGLRVMG